MKYFHLSDEEIINLVLSQDHELYTHIVKRYESKLLRYATTITNDPSDAADAVQQAFIKVYHNLRKFNPKLKFSSWIYRIVHNEAINIVKKNNRFISKDKDLIIALTPSDEKSHELQIQEKEMKQLVHDNLNKISLKYKEVLTLYYLEDKSYPEISDILRIPLGTVSTRISRAKKSFAVLLTKEEI